MDMPKRPIGGGFAWTVPEVMQRDDWICRLAESDDQHWNRQQGA